MCGGRTGFFPVRPLRISNEISFNFKTLLYKSILAQARKQSQASSQEFTKGRSNLLPPLVQNEPQKPLQMSESKGRPERISLSEQVQALSNRRVSNTHRSLRKKLSEPAQYSPIVRTTGRNVSRIKSQAHGKMPSEMGKGQGHVTQGQGQMIDADLSTLLTEMSLMDEENKSDENNEMMTSTVSSISLPPRTPEPDWVLEYGRNPEVVVDAEDQKNPAGYRPKHCWCNRCQIMYRMYKEEDSGLENWGNYPCHQW